MHEGIWTISPCPHGEAGALAQALGVSETTARVLVRRGYEQPGEAKAFLVGELPGHDPFLLGDMAGAVETIKGTIAAGKRICVHGD
jgi:single-stranded-DNA-specific exonuclease